MRISFRGSFNWKCNYRRLQCFISRLVRSRSSSRTRNKIIARRDDLANQLEKISRVLTIISTFLQTKIRSIA